ncbi:single-stranded DNA-binding protein [Gluconobacter cerinus]|uniref:Single-stranded DNA-binding protein n=1 Tax=Gluconobacter cerinus TaxID=38307 RepID=A0A1B6VKK9_9PROT|nr:single-stranded DNA-binding protein [Gluconobacter cerinus]OAJ67753.1 ssDNA-binding protein [Gluconobacter cerinus]
MGNTMNEWRGIGNLGKDPEIRTFQNGDKIANLSLGCTDTWRDRDGNEKKRTFWAAVKVTGRKVSFVEQYLKKGNRLLVGGRMETRKWQDQSGQDRYATEVVCDDFDGKIQNLTPRSESDQSQSGGNSQRDHGRSQNNNQSGTRGGWDAPSNNDLDDEIPF